jgi:hypothetical protein
MGWDGKYRNSLTETIMRRSNEYVRPIKCLAASEVSVPRIDASLMLERNLTSELLAFQGGFTECRQIGQRSVRALALVGFLGRVTLVDLQVKHAGLFSYSDDWIWCRVGF